MWVTLVTDAVCCKNYFDTLKYRPKGKRVISIHSRLPSVLLLPETQQKKVINIKFHNLCSVFFLNIRGMATKQLNVHNSSSPILSIPLFFCPVAALTSSDYVFLSTIVVVSSSVLRWQRHQPFWRRASPALNPSLYTKTICITVDPLQGCKLTLLGGHVNAFVCPSVQQNLAFINYFFI